MKTILRFAVVGYLCVASGLQADSSIDTANKYAWGANIGFMDWRPSAVDGVVIGEYIASGYIYAANVGWIHMGDGTPANNIQYSNASGTDFGVNYIIDPASPGQASLRGFAYGANIGWINFEAVGNPRIRFTDGRLLGYAYSANCGWINLGETGGTVFVQTDYIANGVDSDMDGLADAFEFQYLGGLGGNPSADNDGDGMTNLQEYQEGTNPALANERLRILALAPNTGGTSTPLTFTTTPSRLYSIQTTTAMTLAPPTTWTLNTHATLSTHGPGIFQPDAGTMTTRTVIEGGSSTKRFYRAISVRPLPPP